MYCEKLIWACSVGDFGLCCYQGLFVLTESVRARVLCRPEAVHGHVLQLGLVLVPESVVGTLPYIYTCTGTFTRNIYRGTLLSLAASNSIVMHSM